MARPVVLTDVAGLRTRLGAGLPTTLLDVRWSLAQPDGRADHEAGHIPSAVYVDLDSELAAPPTSEDGRHPLPHVEVLEAAARRWGVSPGVPIVVYDDWNGLAAARAWWLLRWAGVDDVTLLDGGLAAWRRAGAPLETGPVEPQPGTVSLITGRLPVLTADEAAATAAAGVLLDARAAERYRGEVEPIDPRAGHIPGALSAPTSENLHPDGTLLSAAQLRARFAAVGADGTQPVGAYCGSGVTAAHEILALAVAGIDAALYAGSWSQWSADPARPVSVGSR